MKTLLKALMITALLSGTAFAEVEESTMSETPSVDTQQPNTTERSPASADQMSGIWHSMNWAQTEAARINVISAVAKTYWLSVMQVEVLLETIASPESRQRLLTDLYPRITNPGQIGRLGRLLPSGSVPQGLAALTQPKASSHL